MNTAFNGLLEDIIEKRRCRIQLMIT